MKKLVSIVLALALVLACCSVAFAEWTGNGGTKTITVNNAMKGETYSIYKLFNATTNGTDIAYTLIGNATDVPTQVAGIFEKKTITVGEGADAKTYDAITEKGTPSDDEVQDALKDWAAANASAKVGDIPCTAGKVEFTNLTDGYYVIVSTFDGTVNKCIGTSTTDSGVTVYEKNTTEPTPVKTVDDETWSIGDRITYTVTFPGANYMGTGANAKIVTSYTIEDTLPPFLSNVSLESVTINGTDVATSEMKANFADASKKSFDIPWAKKDETTGNKWQSLYNNGTEVIIVYKATLTDIVNVGSVGNTNTVKVTPNVATPEGTPEPWSRTWEDQETIYTYGAALKKTDGTNLLSGATFQIKGLVATETGAGTGIYTVTSYNRTASDYTGASDLVVPASGYIYLIGLDNALTLTGQETDAPDGYNKLTSEFTLTTVVLSKKVVKTTGYAEYDTDGNLIKWQEESFTEGSLENQDLSAITPNALEIVNQAGTELPSTGGIGTTIFYILGGLLVIGAAVILVARRKASN